MKVKISVFVRSKVDLVKFEFVTQAQKTHLEIMESISNVKEATNLKTSRKWLTVAIFRKWQDSGVALWTIMDYHELS